MKEGRKYEECHGTDIVKKVQEGKLRLIWFEKGSLNNLKGVIPIREGRDV